MQASSEGQGHWYSRTTQNYIFFRNVLIKRYYVLDHQMYLHMTRSSNIMMTADTFGTVFLDTETQLYQPYQLHPER